MGVRGSNASKASSNGSVVGASVKLFKVERNEVTLANRARFSTRLPRISDLHMSATIEDGDASYIPAIATGSDSQSPDPVECAALTKALER